MFGTIRKHQKWLWLAIVIPTIITFVWYFGPASRVNSSGARRSSDFGSIGGRKISEAEYYQARREVELHYFVNNERWPEDDRRSGFDPDREAYQWLFFIQKMDQLGIHVGDDVIDDLGRNLVRRFERMGVTSPSVFIQRVLQPHNLSVEDFESFLRHFVGIQEVITLMGVSGQLVTPQDVRDLYVRDHQELATDGIFYSASNYLAEVPAPTPAVLGQFYTNMMVRYAVPERVQVSYIRFNVTNFLAAAEAELKTNAVENLTDRVDKAFIQLGTNATTVFPDAKTPEAVRAGIRDRLVRQQALVNANKSAIEFATALFNLNESNTNRSANMKELARTNNLTVELAEPFDRDSGPKHLDVGADFTKRAFDLTPEEPFSQAIAGRDGVYILGLEKKLPREMPTLEQINDRVLADYKHTQAVRLAQQAARGFYQTLTNGLAQGSSFTNLCGAAKLKPVPLPPFSLATRDLPEIEDLVSLNQLKQAAFTTQLGKVSAPQETAEGSFLLYVRARLPVDQAKMQADLPNYTAALRHSRQQEAFQDWFRREADRALRDTPMIQQKRPGAPGQAAS